jgi:hypothetical protein
LSCSTDRICFRDASFSSTPHGLQVNRPQQFLQRTAMLLHRLLVALQTTAGKLPEILVFEFDVEPGDFVAKLLQRKLQPVAPFAEAGIRIREHPGNALHVGEFYLAGVTPELAIVKGKRRLVAARTCKVTLQLLHLTHAPLYSTAPRILPDTVLN